LLIKRCAFHSLRAAYLGDAPESVLWVESVDNLVCKFIVATVLKKFIPQKPGSTQSPEDTRSGENPAPLQTVPTKTETYKNPVMAELHNKNLLSKDVEIKGSIKFASEFTFDGKIEGEISSNDGILTVGENGDVHGEIKAKSVIVMGKVQGNITVAERCELRARSALIGDLHASRLIIEEGATFVGKSEVTPNKNALREIGIKEKAQEANAPR
jgi:cytoskeletal protein CcmA (bactofilin family)